MNKASWWRRGLRILVGGLVLGVALVPVSDWAPSAVAGASPPPASMKVARHGAGWLATQISANGGDVVSGSPDATDTAYAVLGLYASGVGATAAREAMTFLETHLSAISAGGSDNPGVLAAFILAAHAAAVNPRKFGGTGTANNLVSRLVATQRTSGSDAGLFGSQDPTFDGAFRQGLALAALSASGVAVSKPVVAQGLGWLKRQQCSDALWEAYRADPTSPCPPPDPATFTGPDTNSTSLAIQGLAAYGVHPHRGAAVQQLHQIQSADGGFPLVAASGQSSDPDSTALVIQALVADGQDPGSTSWATSGSTPYAALATFQLGCSAPAANRGAFFFPGSSNPSVIATVQAVPAAAGAPIPVANALISSKVPTLTC